MTFDFTIDKGKARDTGLAITLVMILLEIWLGGGLYLKLALAGLILSMTFPSIFRPAAYVWFGFAHVMGTIVSKILLLLAFGLIVLPVGIIRRMIGKDPLYLKFWKNNNESVFHSRNHQFSNSDLDKPF